VRTHLGVAGAPDGRKVGVMLDTGTTRTLILRSAAVRLDLPRQEARGYRMFGVGGETRVELANVGDLRIGRGSRKDLRLLVAGEQDFGDGVDVLLGEDFLHNFDIEFDLPHNAVRLFETRDCGGASLAYWTTDVTGEVAIDAVDEAHPQIVMTVRINDRPVKALLDSGAGASVLTRREAASLGVTPETPGVVGVGRGEGLGKNRVDSWIGPFRSFAIGNETIRNVAIRFSDLFDDATYAETGSDMPNGGAEPPPMLLGADFLHAHRVLVAHSQRKVYFTYAGGPAFQPNGFERRSDRRSVELEWPKRGDN
jgi:predicted aspartyl protease